MENKKVEWDASYSNLDNHIFYPNEEIIRFVSKYVRKKVGLDCFIEQRESTSQASVLDLGCGIGRHVIYCNEMGLDAYGIDLSEIAVASARSWAGQVGINNVEDKIRQGDITALPWDDDSFYFAVSHGVLDSMPFDIARAGLEELSRTMVKGGLFYCDLISGDDSEHAREFAGEETVKTRHEQGTIQLYFNSQLIYKLFDGLFDVVECHLIRRENIFTGIYASRYHLVLKNIK